MKVSKIFFNESERLVLAFDSFDPNIEPDISVLSPKEKEICSRFRSVKRRREYSFGRNLCRKALRQLNIDCENILNDDLGAPFIENSEYAPAISHSHGKIVVLGYKKEFSFGVDIEKMNFKKISILKEIFSEDKTPDELIVLWTLKEALAKALKTGIREDFSNYDVENFVKDSGFRECDFKNFSEYHGVAVYNENWAAAVVFKREYQLDKNQLVSLMKEWIL